MFNKKKVVSITLALGTILASSTIGHAASYRYRSNYNYVPRNYNTNYSTEYNSNYNTNYDSNYNYYDNYNRQNYNYNWKIITMPRRSTRPSIPNVPGEYETPTVPDKPNTNNKPSTPIESVPTFPESNQGISQMEMEVVRLVNIEREKAGLSPFTSSSELSRVARMKSEDMARNKYFSHTSPTYGSPFDMMRKFGIKYNTAGENIAKGYPSAQAVVKGWMNSSGHRANILNPSFKTLGVGAYNSNGTIYWTQMFTN